jgi:hypothetical protein
MIRLYYDLGSYDTSISPQRPGFNPKLVCVGFLVEKVALGQVFILVLLFFSVSIIPAVLYPHMFIYH